MGQSKFDELLIQLGTGKWNMMYFFAVSYCYLWIPGEFLSGIYLAPDQGYTCQPPENTSVDAISKDSCDYFVNETTEHGAVTRVQYPCTSWVYNTSIYTSTLTSEFDLVCERAHFRATYQSALLFATMFTSIFAGYLADRFGRKTVVWLTQVFATVTSISTPFMTNFTSILVIRFISGAFFLPTIYTLAMEVCEIKHRSLVGILTGLPWAFGTMIWGGLAYFIRNWRYLKLSIALPPLLLYPCLYLMDESPRWLIVKGKHTQALKVLRKAARWNNVELPTDSELTEIFLDIQLEQAKTDKRTEKSEMTKRFDCGKIQVPKLIRTPRIRKLILILCLIMLMVPLAFTGVSLSGDAYSSDPFLYVIIMGVTQIPSFTVSVPLIKRLGRKKSVIGICIISGISMIAMGFIPKDVAWLVMTLAMVGMLCVCSAWMILDVYITELLPTEVRLQGIGTTLLFCQISGVIAPYISLLLAPVVPWAPSVIYGVACFIAAAAALPLTETEGVPMLETVEEYETNPRRQVRSEVPADDKETTTLKFRM